MMNTRREQIRDLVARLFDAEACADELMGYIERGAPALRYYLELKAAGRLSIGRAAYEKFLGSMPEPLFGHLLARALAFLRGPARMLEAPATQDPELCSLAAFLWFDEQNLDGYAGTDEELYEVMKRFAHLTLLEEQQRGGGSVWTDGQSLSNRVADEVPPRLFAADWMTKH
jgi:hypothetical protein